jgi:hypothetical protein
LADVIEFAAWIFDAPHGGDHEFLAYRSVCGSVFSEVLLGHAKGKTTALYTRVATKTIRKVMSPLDRLSLLEKRADPPA